MKPSYKAICKGPITPLVAGRGPASCMNLLKSWEYIHTPSFDFEVLLRQLAKNNSGVKQSKANKTWQFFVRCVQKLLHNIYNLNRDTKSYNASWTCPGSGGLSVRRPGTSSMQVAEIPNLMQVICAHALLRVKLRPWKVRDGPTITVRLSGFFWARTDGGSPASQVSKGIACQDEDTRPRLHALNALNCDWPRGWPA